jgi:hypothetical protein
MTIQTISVRAIGSFHQMRWGGGVIAMVCPLVGYLAIGIVMISMIPQIR